MNNNDDLLKNYIESQKRQREIIESQKRINDEIKEESKKGSSGSNNYIDHLKHFSRDTKSISKENKRLKENIKEPPVKGHNLILIYIDLTGCFSDEKIAIACGYFKIDSNGQKIVNFKDFNSELIAAHKKYKKYLTLVGQDELVYIYEKFIERNSIEEIAIVCGYFDIKQNGEKIACVDDFMKAYDSAIKESRKKSYMANYGNSISINNGTIVYSHPETMSYPMATGFPPATKCPGSISGPIYLNRINHDWMAKIDWNVWGYRKPIFTIFKDRLCVEDEEGGEWEAFITEKIVKENEKIYQGKQLIRFDPEEYVDNLGFSEPMMSISGTFHYYVNYSLKAVSGFDHHDLFELYGLREKDIAKFFD